MSTTAQRQHWIGADLAPHGGPGAAARGDRLHRRPAAARACCTPPCCAARTRTPGSCASTPPRRRALPGVLAVLTGAGGRASSSTRCPASAPSGRAARAAVERSATSARRWRSSPPSRRYMAEDALALIDGRVRAAAASSPTLEAGDGRGRRAGAREPRLATSSSSKTFTFGDVDGDFAAADRVIRRELRWHRASASAAGDRRRGRAASTRPAGGWTCGRTPTCSTSSAGSWSPTRWRCAPSKLNIHPHVRGRQLRLQALRSPR